MTQLRYQRLRTLGHGGFGEVVLGRAISEAGFSKLVALKVLHPSLATDERVLQRLRDEARVLGLVRHRAIVGVDALLLLDGQWTIVLEYIEGADLAAVLEQAGPLPVPVAMAITAEVADALDRAFHTEGAKGPLRLEHRDVKPANIRVTPDGDVKLLDFGIASAEFAAREAQPPGDGQEGPDGSPPYMAPERFAGVAGPAADVYALGSTLLALVTGQPMGVCTRQARHAARLAQLDDTDLPRAAAELIRAMVAWDPAGRPTAAEVRDTAEPLRGGLRPWAKATVGALVHDAPRAPAADRSRITMTLRGLRAIAGRASADSEPSPPRAGQRARLVRGARALLLLGGTAALGLAGLFTFREARAWQEARAAASRERAVEGRAVAVEARMAEQRAAGQAEEAAQAFEAFADDPANAGTRALTAALLREAARAAEREDPDGQLTALATAYAGAAGVEDEHTVAGSLADALEARQDWAALERLLEQLPPDEPRSLRQGAAVRLARMDLDGALGRWDRAAQLGLPPEQVGAAAAPVVRALAVGTPTVHAQTLVVRVDLEGDGIPELAMWTPNAQDDAVTLVRARPGLPTIGILQQPATGVFGLNRDPGEPGFLLTQRQDPALHEWDLTLSQWDGLSFTPRFRTRVNGMVTAAGTLRRAQGGAMMLLGLGPYVRDLRSLTEAADGSWVVGHPNPAIDAAASDPDAILAADLDADGEEELILGLGPWSAYDVRVLRPGTTPDALALAARLKLGDVTSLATVETPDGTLIAVGVAARFLNPRVFGSEQPYGPERGVLLLRLDGDGLSVARRLPVAARVGASFPPSVWTLFVGDLDGDGRQDVVATVHWRGDNRLSMSDYATTIFRQLADGSFASIQLGCQTLEVLDVDGDGDAELLTWLDGRIWVLGTGDRALPSVPTAEPVEVPAFPGDPGKESPWPTAWQRAGQLERLGLADAAASAWQRLGRAAAGQRLGSTALLRAARLWAATDAPERAADAERAADLFQEISRQDGPDQQEALEGAAAALMDAGRYAEALDVARRLTAKTPDSPQWRRLAELLQPYGDDALSVALRFDQPLEEGWEVDDPLAFQRDPDRGALHLRAASRRVLARLPVALTGGPLGLEIDIEFLDTDWSSELAFSLVSRHSGVQLSLCTQTGGGGGANFRDLLATAGETGQEPNIWTAALNEALPEPQGPSRWLLRVERTLDGSAMLFTGTELTGPRRFRHRAPNELWPDGEAELVIASTWSLHAATLTGASDLLLHAVRIDGARQAPRVEASLVARAGRLFADQRGEEARTLLDRLVTPGRADPSDALQRLHAVAHAQAGDLGPARRLYSSALARRAVLTEGSAAQEQAKWLLRFQRDWAPPLLREALGPAFLTLYDSTWFMTMAHQWGRPSMRASVLRDLAGIEDIQPGGCDQDLTRVRARLLTLRGRAQVEEGALEPARSTLAAALATATACGVGAEDHHWVSSAQINTAKVLLALDGVEAAVASFQASLATNETPELLLDAARRDGGLDEVLARIASAARLSSARSP